MSQRLFGALAKDCMHLSGNGGGKAAVAQTQDYLKQHPDHHVIKSDVKRYYASIDHVILHTQLHQLLPNENTLNRLLWNFMRRTVEFGGNYRDVTIGLPLGASLSPLFSALYLSPLDDLAKNTPNTFYRRYMDDWVWVFPKKQHLRTAMKKQYGILQALRVAMHPAKTFIGKVKKGFDFPGFHLTPTGVTVSDTALSRHEQKVARLYEQGAKPKRIRTYRLRWLVWATAAVWVAPATAAQIVDPAVCGISDFFGDDVIQAPGNTVASLASVDRPSTQFYSGILGVLNWVSIHDAPPNPPLSGPPSPLPPVTANQQYLAFGEVSTGDYCLYSFTTTPQLDLGVRSEWALVSSLPSSATPTQNIPIFGPFGLLAMALGLLWFGRRYRKN